MTVNDILVKIIRDFMIIQAVFWARLSVRTCIFSVIITTYL